MSSVISGVQTTLSQNLGGVAHKLAPADQQFSLDQVPDQSGKVAVVTGGSEGIGYGCTHTLLSKNISKLFILSLSKEIVDGAKKAIADELGQDKADRTHWIQCDLSDWKRVTEVAKQISDSTDRLDILINNAARGIMTYQLADNGVELHMAINLIGHVTLTSHLLPLLKKTAEKGDKVRIVNLASNAHQNAPKDTKFESLDELNQDLGAMAQYGRSKLADLLYARYLARHLTPAHPNILANATHPGVVRTKQSEELIHEPYPLAGYAMSTGMSPFKKDQFEGCVSTMFAATTTEKAGQYICPPAAIEPGSELAQNEELGEQLMKLTREIVTQKTKAVEEGCPMKFY
ncbi:hypothetical protein B0A55_07729 [Friedmanniomyces simplex]|uniref:Oxidoreductase bli-4, mitochondrial n=2 Tax=Friedmanniomyces simplex TaxID=329884 RepID=A0A4U0X0I1_9PEZI|nr:hypothetical protein B0A55_07729 [Friedmanniomyces simplex]